MAFDDQDEISMNGNDDEKLYPCKSCGALFVIFCWLLYFLRVERTFRAAALAKHAKICKKVFQSKRREFKVEFVEVPADFVAPKVSMTIIVLLVCHKLLFCFAFYKITSGFLKIGRAYFC
jgi:hypothetical protein